MLQQQNFLWKSFGRNLILDNAHILLMVFFSEGAKHFMYHLELKGIDKFTGIREFYSSEIITLNTFLNISVDLLYMTYDHFLDSNNKSALFSSSYDILKEQWKYIEEKIHIELLLTN